MLLHAWQGFTHIDPLQGNVDPTLFDGRLKDIVVEARLELNERTDEEVREIADRIAKCFADCPNLVNRCLLGTRLFSILILCCLVQMINYWRITVPPWH